MRNCDSHRREHIVPIEKDVSVLARDEVEEISGFGVYGEMKAYLVDVMIPCKQSVPFLHCSAEHANEIGPSVFDVLVFKKKHHRLNKAADACKCAGRIIEQREDLPVGVFV